MYGNEIQLKRIILKELNVISYFTIVYLAVVLHLKGARYKVNELRKKLLIIYDVLNNLNFSFMQKRMIVLP